LLYGLQSEILCNRRPIGVIRLGNKSLWVIPTVLLLLLMVASATRWQTVASRSEASTVTKWQKDRWTGTVILVRYSYRWVNVEHLGHYEDLSNMLTVVWRWAVVITLVWLGWSVFKTLRIRRLSAST
jgi:hypothetical protein